MSRPLRILPAEPTTQTPTPVALERALDRVAERLDDLGNSLVNVSSDPLNFRERARRSRALRTCYHNLEKDFERLRMAFGVEPRRWATLPPEVTAAVDTLLARIASVPKGRRAAKSALKGGGKDAS